MSIRVVDVRGLRGAVQRSGICYVGRSYAGWSGHKLANPFRPMKNSDKNSSVEECLSKYRLWILKRPTLEEDLAALWEQCEHGKNSLGCWCTSAEYPSESPVVCHAQILAVMLHNSFVEPKSVGADLLEGLQQFA